MSRASAGSFADFFPTAPSVLQRKQERSFQDSLDPRRSSTRSSVHSASWGDTAVRAATNQDRLHKGSGTATDDAHTHSPRDDIDCQQGEVGDLLNGVGSASSHASTASSVFSNQKAHAISNSNGTIPASHVLTPLTNVESSPPEKGVSPTYNKAYYQAHVDNMATFGAPNGDPSQSPSAAITPVHTPPENDFSLFPPPGEPRGMKATYDPELDPKLSKTERKKYKVRYRTFGEEVRRIGCRWTFE